MGTRLILSVVISLAVVMAVLPPLWADIPGAGGMRVLFEADSVYHHIVVAEDNDARYLRFDRAFQSGMLLRNHYESPFLYPAYAHLGLIFRPQAKRVLVVGLGGGSIPKRFWRANRSSRTGAVPPAVGAEFREYGLDKIQPKLTHFN